MVCRIAPRPNNDVLSAAEAASWGALFGYEMFLRAAASASSVLARARMFAARMFNIRAAKFAAECSDAHLQFFAQFVVHAGKLMQRPRRHGDEG